MDNQNAVPQEMLSVHHYQEVAKTTAIYDKLERNFKEKHNAVLQSNPELKNDLENVFQLVRLSYVVLGLTSEAGEVAGKLKKIIRDSNGLLSDEQKIELGKEVGDTLWYDANLCQELGMDMGIVAEQNLAKLLSRKERGVLQGSGDNR